MLITIMLSNKNSAHLSCVVKEHNLPCIRQKINFLLENKIEIDKLCEFFLYKYLDKDEEFSANIFLIDKDNIEYICDQYYLDYPPLSKAKHTILCKANNYLIEETEKEYTLLDKSFVSIISEDSDDTISTLGKILGFIDKLDRSSPVESIHLPEENIDYPSHISDLMLCGGYWFI
jgi:hypothetical protein